ncbi:AFG1 family ATPase [Pseudoalteromonas sp. SMS1]|uniref:cell division protein ZapE n=1 Tax=Pseudoalteromonas sp. SMS1 TaxID=2908894 RepID=UPI001EEEC86C|nr:cell division protein ZapE [Pseudoalteromonas sp. SMS1]MCF2856044.1 AFG1 family ATPase [Pseudoalteromonas sp. SMS1]
MSIIQSRYDKLVNENILTLDQSQSNAISALDNLLVNITSNRKTKGIYLYGPVGRGKSFLMDLFFESLESSNKQRLHFHHFMAKIHQQLREIQGVKNPLQNLAKQWATHTKVLCFDEFFVKDIGDAMILAGLLEAFIKHGIIFVTTSNTHPSELYKNGLQRSRFEPTIKLLLSQCNVVNVCGEFDHRFKNGFSSRYYFVKNQTKFDSVFRHISGVKRQRTIEVNGRPIFIEGACQTAILANFLELCSSPRSTSDYIELANQYEVIFVSGVQQMGVSVENGKNAQGIEEGYIRPQQNYATHTLDDEARRFIALVDECYDRKKLVVISTEVELGSLYLGEQLAFEFERTKSRLVEMQSWQLVGLPITA